jgi:hypothetical protein
MKIEMLVPKEKARQIILRMYNNISKIMSNEERLVDAKHCAVEAVDVLITEWNYEGNQIKQRYWMDVRNEIERK